MTGKQFLSLLIAVVLAVTGIVLVKKSRPHISRDSMELTAQADEGSAEPGKSGKTSATMLCFGDNLIHNTLYQQASVRTNGNGYDFSPVYENIKDMVQAADIAVINQETMMAKSFPVSSYPMFNTPTDMAKCLADTGFDVLTISTNHSLDVQSKGLIETLDLINSTPGLQAAGAYHSRDEYTKFKLIDANGISFAFVSFVEHTNGITLPADKEDYLIYWDETEDIRNVVSQADEAADVVVVCMHGGTEYADYVDDNQRKLVDLVVECGADCVVGTHPHCIQPVETVKGPDGADVPVMWSLGNLVSAQKDDPKRLVGGIGSVTFTKDLGSGKVTVSKPVMDVSVTHYGYGFSNIKIYTLSQYNSSLASVHGIGNMTMDYIYNRVNELFGEFLKEEYRRNS